MHDNLLRVLIEGEAFKLIGVWITIRKKRIRAITLSDIRPYLIGKGYIVLPRNREKQIYILTTLGFDIIKSYKKYIVRRRK